VPLGPFYLIWENIDDQQMRAEGDYAWPYQLAGVDLIRVSDPLSEARAARELVAARAARISRVPHPLQPLPTR
jgi:hypothetical protein